jgi:hypothetical protein
LYELVTEFKDGWKICELALSAGKDEDWAQEWMTANDWPLALREDLEPEEIELIKPYVYEGPKTLALNVRYAGKDEQAEG